MPEPTTRTTSETPSRPVRILQVGLGTWGASWADVVREDPGVTSAGWVDPSPAALADAPAELKTFSALPDALDALTGDARPDAVLITAALPAHAPVARAALEAGMDVLVEKPFVPTMAEAAQLVALAEETGRILMVSQNYRFHPAPRRVAELVAQGRLGRVGAVRIDFRKRFPPPADHPYRRGLQPLLLDMFVHHADLMRYVLGREPVSVACSTWSAPWSSFRDPASGAMTVDFGDGIVVSWRGSWDSTSTPTLWAGAWEIEGEDGVLAWSSRGDDDEPVRDWATIRGSGRDPQPIDLPEVAYLDRAGSLRAFANAVARREQPDTSGRDNLGTLAICLAAVRSASEGRRVAIDEVRARPTADA